MLADFKAFIAKGNVLDLAVVRMERIDLPEHLVGAKLARINRTDLVETYCYVPVHTTTP